MSKFNDDGNGYDNNDENYYPQPMNDHSFMQLKQSIGRESFDENKMQMIPTLQINIPILVLSA